MTREEVLSKFDGIKGGGDQYYARCPAHPDKKQSLSILFAASGKTAFRCHTGCEYKEIIAAAGLQESDTFPDKPHDPNPKKSYAKVIDTYDYHFATGTTLVQKLRKDDKTFSWRHKDASGNWVWKKSPEPILSGRCQGSVLEVFPCWWEYLRGRTQPIAEKRRKSCSIKPFIITLM